MLLTELKETLSMVEKNIVRITSIDQIHKVLGLGTPQHPLVSIIPINEKIIDFNFGDATYVFDFYQISLKSGIRGVMRYGKSTYDYGDSCMVFTKPGQAISYAKAESIKGETGWVLLFHPDLIRRSDLGRSIAKYTFFSYETHEALHLSSDESTVVTSLSEKIEKEYQQRIDCHTQNLIVANIELLLAYCTRYYDRQFYVRENLNHDLITKFERLLTDYFHSDKPTTSGLPTVAYCAEQLNFSSHYLSDLLKKETGKHAQQHIHDYIIDIAMNQLLSTNDPVSKIAYDLGFEYPQHFSKFFKKKTGVTPREYRLAS